MADMSDLQVAPVDLKLFLPSPQQDTGRLCDSKTLLCLLKFRRVLYSVELEVLVEVRRESFEQGWCG